MLTYKDPCAYATIQEVTEDQFHSFINRTPDQINSIVIAGAHHGYEIDRMHTRYPNAHFYAFEAYPEHFNVLKNRYTDCPYTTVYNVALSDENKKIPFYELTLAGSGSILEFKEEGQTSKISNVIEVEGKTLNSFNIEKIDMLWCDVQGAELKVLKGTDLNRVNCLFLEIKTREFMNPIDKEHHYKGACYLDELEEYLKGKFTLHSIGLDNINHNGTGNSFWVKS